MRRAMGCALVALLLGSQTNFETFAQSAPAPHTQEAITYSGGDGSSVEQAIVIKGAADSSSGIRAEYAWLAQRYPGYKRKTQNLIKSGERMYDRFEIDTAYGQARVVFFDITDFFGRLK